jgi:glycosyltransferase involved in cell wall biosynthesis
MKSLRILFLTYSFSPSIGGIEATSELLAEAFVEAGHQVKLITMTKGELTNASYKIIRSPSLKVIIEHLIWADVVHENNPCLRLSWPRFFIRKPLLVILHTWINRANGSTNLIDKFKLRWLSQSTKVIAVSSALRNRCYPKAIVIGNSYNSELFVTRVAERNKDFVFLGRLVSDKGVDMAIRTFAHITVVNPIPELEGATLTIIGTGSERENLEILANNISEPGRVKFIGPLIGNDLVNELNRHSFQFIPSIWEEPFGIVALEGIACGLIPIASDGGGLPDAVGEAGVLFKRASIDSMIEVTSALVKNVEQQEKCRRAAPNHLAEFGKETIVKKIVKELQSIA